MSNFLFSLNIVMPMAILLAIGYLFKRSGFFSDEFIKVAKKFCFYVLLASSLFKNLYDSTLSVFPVKFISFVVIAIFVEVFLSFLFAKTIADQREQIGVIIQGSFRSNFAYIGIPLASMFFADGELLSGLSSEISLLSIFVIPLFNIFAVIALTIYSENKDDTSLLKKSFLGILRNPCIISIFLGLLVILFRMMVPSSAFFVRDRLPFLYKALGYLASMSTPFAFLLVGSSLDLGHVVKDHKKLILTMLMRDLIFPILALLAAYGLNVAEKIEYAILVSVFASPTAVSSAIMAAEMGADQDLANEIVVYTTMFSMISLLIIIYALKGMGCL